MGTRGGLQPFRILFYWASWRVLKPDGSWLVLPDKCVCLAFWHCLLLTVPATALGVSCLLACVAALQVPEHFLVALHLPFPGHTLNNPALPLVPCLS